MTEARSAEVDAGDFTVDAFHRGAFHLVQPRARGHRSGMDAMVLAAAVPSRLSGAVADFGAGAGAAGLAVAARCPGTVVTLVERSAEMLDCARRTLALPSNAHLAGRTTILAADVGLRGGARSAAGLADQSFEFVVMNPPFNAAEDRRSPDPLRRDAHVMGATVLDDWIRTAAAVLRPGGGIAVIVRASSIAPLLAALAGRFGGIEVVPVHPRPDAPAIRVVARGVQGSRARMQLMPALTLHEAGSDRFSEYADAINNGRAALFAD